MATKEINETHIEKLKQQRRVVGFLHFEHKEDQNFSKWYSMTENLVIRAFGQKSNQVYQLRDLRNNMMSIKDLSFQIENRMKNKDAKEKLKDLLTVFMEELELDMTMELKPNFSRVSSTSIKIKNTQSITQFINVSATIKQIIETIKQNEPDLEKIKEAENKLEEFENEIKSPAPIWAKVKNILVWLLNFSRDAFLQVLPIILEKYKKG